MNVAEVAVFFWERLPLNSRLQDLNYGFKNLSGIHGVSISSLPTLICFWALSRFTFGMSDSTLLQNLFDTLHDFSAIHALFD